MERSTRNNLIAVGLGILAVGVIGAFSIEAAIALTVVLLGGGFLVHMAANPAPGKQSSTRSSGPRHTLPEPAPLPTEPTLAATQWGAIMLDTGEQRLSIVLLPTGDPANYDELSRVKQMPDGVVDALVVFNGPRDGVLAGSQVARTFSPRRILATHPDAPIDVGFDDDEPSEPQRLRDTHKFGVWHMVHRDGLLIGTWPVTQMTVVLGTGVTCAQLAALGASYFAGTLAADATADTTAVLDAVTNLRHAFLVEDGRGEAALDAEFLAQMGVAVTVLGTVTATVASAVQTLQAQIATGDDEGARAKLAAAYAAHGRAPDLLFQQGVLEAASGDMEAAIAAFREAAQAQPPMAEATHSLASLLMAQGRVDEALEAADQAHAALPDDPLCTASAIRGRILAGRTQEARALFEEVQHVLTVPLRVGFEDFFAAPTELPETYSQRFTAHAEISVVLSEAAADRGDAAEAERIARCGLRLDHRHLGSHTALAAAMVADGRNDDAIAHLETAVEEAEMGQMLRFNLGNRYLAADRIDDAIGEFQRCIELLPEWSEPRVNLAAALRVAGREAEAAPHEAVLAERGIWVV